MAPSRLQPEPQLAAQGQQPRGEIQGHAVDVDAQHLIQTHVGMAHERQRRQEVLAVLAIGHPRLAFAIAFERQRVDQRGAAVHELHVVRAAVLERHAVLEGELLDRSTTRKDTR